MLLRFGLAGVAVHFRSPPIFLPLPATLASLIALYLYCPAFAQDLTAPPPLQRWVLMLGETDPALRERAVKELTAAGVIARPLLVEATHYPDPEIRSRARELLLKLPWHLPEDPVEIRRTLENYGNHEENGRRNLLKTLEGSSADPQLVSRAMGRVFLEEPAESVQWFMTAALRRYNDPAFKKRLRDIDPANRSAPVLALCGWAWIEKDLDKARLILEDAIDAIIRRPPINRTTGGYDSAQAEFVFEMLKRLYVATQRYNEAGHVLRRRAIVDRVARRPDAPPDVVCDLFALHARYGPLEGFAGDLMNFLPLMESPELVYCVGQAVERKAGRAVANTVYWTARAMSLGSAPNRARVGRFLADQNWNDLAEAEFTAVLRLSETPGVNKGMLDCDAHFQLARLAMFRQDDYAIAEHYRQAFELLDRSNLQLQRPREPVEADMHWRYVRIARKKNDLTGVEPHLARLLDLTKLTHTAAQLNNIALDVVPVLKELRRDAEAKQLFQRAYTIAKRRLDADPTSPEAMNHVAWLNARCDENLDEAVALATAAMKAKPDNAAYMDTAAEANYRAGNREEAIRLETRALELRPNDPFMTQQLKRFKENLPPTGAEPL